MTTNSSKQAIDLYRQYLKLTDEQMALAASVVETCRNRGIFHSIAPIDELVKPGLFDSTYSRYWHTRFSNFCLNHTLYLEYNIRVFTAYLLNYLRDNWQLQQTEAVEQFCQILSDAKPVLASQFRELVIDPNSGQTTTEADFVLLRFIEFTMSTQLIPAEKIRSIEEEYNPIEEKLEYDSQTCFSTTFDQDIQHMDLADIGLTQDEISLDDLKAMSSNVQDNPFAFPQLSVNGQSTLVHPDLKVENQVPFEMLLNESNQVTPNKFLKKISQNLFGSFDPQNFSSPLLQPEENKETKRVTIADINRFTIEDLINRLAESDIDLLSSLFWHSIQACPNCFSRSLAERKKETDEGTHYCSSCRKRVKPAYVPYYKEHYTADPHIAVTKHRGYLTDLLNNKLASLKRLELLKVSFWKRRCYFMSIDQVDEKAYNDLMLLYEAFYTDYTADTPDAKLQIHLCSNGGNVFQAKRIIALINANHHITHLQGNVLNSAAFDIFFSVRCSRELTPYAQGMYHLSRSAHYVLENGVIQGLNQQFNGQESIELCKQVRMTDTEIERINAGEDVYFSYDRLTDFMKHSPDFTSCVEAAFTNKDYSISPSQRGIYDQDIIAIHNRFSEHDAKS